MACTNFCSRPAMRSSNSWRVQTIISAAAEGVGARTIELCKKLKPLNFTWSCTSRVTTDYETLKAMKESGCRLLIMGYESGDQPILKNIKKGATIDMALRFTDNCKK